jgi:hypothetical protein
MGLVATTVAVVLGLLISSAKDFYDTQSKEVVHLSASVLMLDRLLAHYGPEAMKARAALRASVASALDARGSAYGKARSGTGVGEVVLDDIEALSPKDDKQQSLKAQALNTIFQISQTRWLIFEQDTVHMPTLLLTMLILWLMLLFVSFGIFAPRNLMVMSGLFLTAAAVCGAVLLILEMYHPQNGMIPVSDMPLRETFAKLGQ